MDAAFMPTEIAVKHFVSHTFTINIGPSIASLGKPIRNLIFGVVAIYCVTDIVRTVAQAVLKKDPGRGSTDAADELK